MTTQRTSRPLTRAALVAGLASAILFGACDTAPTAPETATAADAFGLTSRSNAKVAVCHRRGPTGYKRIEVAAPAVEAHLRHGDSLPGEDVPSMDGYFFDDGCAPVPVFECTVEYTEGGGSYSATVNDPARLPVTGVGSATDPGDDGLVDTTIAFDGFILENGIRVGGRTSFTAPAGSDDLVQMGLTAANAEALACPLVPVTEPGG